MKRLCQLALMGFLMISCNDSDNSGNGDGALGYTHNELAEKFVQELNLDEEFSVTLAKKSTDSKNFAVIYDPYTDSYDAINLDNYDPGLDNASDYYFSNSARSFFDLDVIPAHWESYESYELVGTDEDGFNEYDWEYVNYKVETKYRDRNSNMYFEKSLATPKDLAKVAALKEVVELNKSAQFLSANFGLSLSRSREIATLARHWKKSSKKGMTDEEQDSFATELLGFSITAAKRATRLSLEGNSGELNTLVQGAALTNNITPEHASQLMGKLFSL